MATPFDNSSLLYSGSYEHILTTKADIDAWEAQTLTILEMLANPRTGREVLGAIRQSHRTIVIVPDSGTEGEIAGPTAKRPEPEGKTSGVDSRTVDTAASLSGCTILPFGSKQIAVAKSAGLGADAALCHELCHCLQPTGGRAISGSYNDMDTFGATLVTNIYLSEKNQALRASHFGCGLPDSSFLESKTFLTNTGASIGQLCSSAPGLTRRLASVPARFNPIRQYYAEQHP